MADNPKEDSDADVVVTVDVPPTAAKAQDGSGGLGAKNRDQLRARFNSTVSIHDVNDTYGDNASVGSNGSSVQSYQKVAAHKTDDDMDRLQLPESAGSGFNDTEDELFRLKRTLSTARTTQSNAKEIGLCIRLVTTLQTYYMPTFITSQYAQELMKALQIQHQGSFNLQPNGVWASFGTVTRYLPTSTIYNLRNLEDVEQLVQDIVAGDMTDLDEADRMLDAIDVRQGSYPFWVQILAFSLIGFCTCITFYQGRFIEAGFAALFSAFAGAFNEYLKRQGDQHAHLVKLTEFVVPAATGIVVSAVSLWVDTELCHISIAMATILWWLPGFAVTFGCAEMLNGNVLTGSARMAYGLLLGQLLAFGLYAGAAFVTQFDSEANKWLQVTQCTPLVTSDDPTWKHLLYELVFYPVIFITELIIFNCHWRQWFSPAVILLITRLIMFGLTMGLGYTGTATTGIGAAVMIVAMFFMRFVNKDASPTVLMLPTIFLMLPGSYTVRNAFAMFFGGSYMGQSQMSFSTDITLIGLATAVGMLMGAALASLIFKVFLLITSCFGAVSAKLRGTARGSYGSGGSGGDRRRTSDDRANNAGFGLLVGRRAARGSHGARGADAATDQSSTSSATLVHDAHVHPHSTPPEERKSGLRNRRDPPDICLTPVDGDARRASQQTEPTLSRDQDQQAADSTDITDAQHQPVLRSQGSQKRQRAVDRQRALTNPTVPEKDSPPPVLSPRGKAATVDSSFAPNIEYPGVVFDTGMAPSTSTPSWQSVPSTPQLGSPPQPLSPAHLPARDVYMFEPMLWPGAAPLEDPRALRTAATQPAPATKPTSLWAFDFDPPLKHQQRAKAKQAKHDHAKPAPTHTPSHSHGGAHAHTGRFTVSAAHSETPEKSPAVVATAAVPTAPRSAMKHSSSAGNLVTRATAADLGDIHEDEPTTSTASITSTPTAARRRAPTVGSSTTPPLRPPDSRPSVSALDLATALDAIDSYTRHTGGYEVSRTMPRMPSQRRSGDDLQSLFALQTPASNRSRAHSQSTHGSSLSNPPSQQKKGIKQPFIPI